MNIPYLLWDHDGVLVDSERWYFAATREVLSDFGVEMDQATYLSFMAIGRSCFDLARAAGIDEAGISCAKAARDTLYHRMLGANDISMPGVREVLGLLGESHRMAIVSTGRRADLDWIHRNDDMLDAFDFAITYEDCASCKPHPAPYLLALDRFGITAREAIAIEDSSRGLASARGAGIDCVVVPTAFTAAQGFDGAYCVLEDIRKLPGLLGARQAHRDHSQ